ncbi:hypothetical protein HMPREF0322_00397 [Desulfitobacterium hafniense DP7]|uniref:Uncharacterized protein n=2 Tax=Desulfitobacterium hafniense TaxID=49338 RepID=G9XHH2_DESHA|nr:hypothetical protein [Desulfitobacterium hafniense]EHL08974.1 hypothetical protein HMPREF0322_00397 [Desulfitobacterium hafniense DP7]
MLNILKEYLVSVGFKVDDASLAAARKAMGSADKAVSGFTDSAVSNFAKAGAGMAAFFATAQLGIAKYVTGLAKADLQNDIFARKMWTTTENAKAYQTALSALDVSLEDLYFSPELMGKYQQLRQEGLNMMVPTDEYKEQMQIIRSVIFEFQRLKQIGSYATQWIGYYLTKYLEGPLGDIKEKFGSLNEMLQEKMPIWTKHIAQVLSWFVRLGSAAWSIKDGLLAAVAVFAAFKLVNMGPLGALIIGLTTLLLLVDDYKTYSEGGESLFSGFWRGFDDAGVNVKKFMDQLKVSEDFREFITSVGDLGGALRDLGIDTMNALDKLAQLAGYENFGSLLENNIIKSLRMMGGLIQAIVYELNAAILLIEALGKSFKGDFSGWSSWWDMTKKGWNSLFDGLFGEDSWLGRAFNPKEDTSSYNSEGVKQFMDGYSNSGNASGIPYVYPQNTTTVNNRPEIKSTYNIYGAPQPEAFAKTADRTLTALLIRANRGVIV